jgi:GAF domain-containing protein
MKGIRRITTIRRQADQLQLIQELGHQIATVELDALLERFVQLVHSSLGYPIVAIALVEGEDLVLCSAAPDRTPALPERLPLDGHGLTAWAARHAEPVLVGKLEDDPRYSKQEASGDIRSQLVVPLCDRSGVLGVIDIQSNQADAFDHDDLGLMTTLAEYAAVAIKNALLDQADQERRRELERLQQTEQLLFADMEQSYN